MSTELTLPAIPGNSSTPFAESLRSSTPVCSLDRDGGKEQVKEVKVKEVKEGDLSSGLFSTI